MANSFFKQLPQLRKFMGYLAIMGGVLLLTALAFTLLGVHFNDALLVVGFGSLAVVAFLLGYVFPTDVAAPLARVRSYAMYLLGWSLAVVLIGTLFVLMHRPGGRTMLLAGGLSLVISGVVWLFYFLRRNK